MPPTVSILMSVYNSSAYIGEAIESMLGQTFADFEFIIVDDGSTDASVDIVRQYASADKRLHHIILPENVGLASALNHGLASASGQYIARMDSDDMSLPDRLAQQVRYLDNHSEVGVLGSRMQVVDKNKKPLFVYEVPTEHSVIVWNIFFGRTFAHPSVMMRRELLQSVNGYNDSLSVAQDVDLWARLVGLTLFANLPDQLLLYRTHERATSVDKAEQQNIVLRDVSKHLLQTLWGEVSDDTVRRFFNVRSGKSEFVMKELEHVTAEMTQLIRSLLDAGWIREDEVPLLVAEMERRTNLAEPRRRKFWKFWRDNNN